MAKIHVSELTETQLNNAVARALGWVDYPTDSIEKGDYWHADPSNPCGVRWLKRTYRPSTEWNIGGPIIESNEICISRCQFGEGWAANNHGKAIALQYGPTSLIAAMRCFVTTKLGEEIDEELIK